MPVDAFTLIARVDDGQNDVEFVGEDVGAKSFRLKITKELMHIWVEGAGGGGGGGGGSAGRGAGKGQGGAGAGGNGAYCTEKFQLIDLREGDWLNIRLGRGGVGGAGGPGPQVAPGQVGRPGSRGYDTVLTVNDSVFLTFVGCNGGGGGGLAPGPRWGGIPGAPGDATPPNHIVNYFYAAGGSQGAKGTNVGLPEGGRGGLGGTNYGGGGGGASLHGTGGKGGDYTIPCSEAFKGELGGFGAGGGGGAGGGAGTCDNGAVGGAGGLGYVWIYKKT